MSSAFDTVVHKTLLQRLEQRLGLTGTCLAWFKSYLSSRRQSVVINGVHSSARELSVGVPQGSVLGPKLYNVYTLPLGEIIEKHNMGRMPFADHCTTFLAFRLPQTV